jgi:hypothetical protein
MHILHKNGNSLQIIHNSLLYLRIRDLYNIYWHCKYYKFINFNLSEILENQIVAWEVNANATEARQIGIFKKPSESKYDIKLSKFIQIFEVWHNQPFSDLNPYWGEYSNFTIFQCGSFCVIASKELGHSVKKRFF